MSEHNDLVLERTLNAPRDLVWKAYTTPDLVKQWWAPKPYETPEVEFDLKPGGVMRTRMTGPDGFDQAGEGCFLEVIEGKKIVWTNALLPGYRPVASIEDCGGFPFTAIITFEDAGDGKTFYRAVALHRNEADRETHAQMGFQEGWGTVADQLEKLAQGLGQPA